MKTEQRGKVIAILLLVAALPISSCTSFTGNAHVTNLEAFVEEPLVGFPGLLSPTKNESHVLYIHGMGDTSPNFAVDLLEQSGVEVVPLLSSDNSTLKECNQDEYCRSVKFEDPFVLRGEGLHCDSDSMDCEIKSFGELRRFKVEHEDKTVYLYSYFWDTDADKFQEKYILTNLPKNVTPPVPINRYIKNRFVNRGFSDATIYLGQFGKVMRKSLENALCMIIRDAIHKNDINESGDDACELAQNGDASNQFEMIEKMEFNFISKSLGSRYLFDTLLPIDQVDELQLLGIARDKDTNLVSEEAKQSIDTIKVKRAIVKATQNVYLLANQLPLLGLGAIRVSDESFAANRDYIFCRYVAPMGTHQNCQNPKPAPLQDGYKIQTESENNAQNQLNPDADFKMYSFTFFGFANAVKGKVDEMTFVAFHDPNDILGYKAGAHLTAAVSDNIKIIEIEHRNAPVIAFVFADPRAAHANEDRVPSAAAIIWWGGCVDSEGKIKAPNCESNE